MEYQLVLQFQGDSASDLESLVELEDRLIELLSPHHDVDGHDIGSGEMNIFIFTNDPIKAFDLAKGAIPHTLSARLRCAYRHAEKKDEFTVIWPVGDERDFIIA